MTVKVIVTDMDGTFLDDAKQYDRDRFQAQFEQLKARNIEFVVASGNQYYQLISFFPELKDQISFVAENGALVFDHGEQIFHGELTRHESQIVIGELLKDKGLNFVACGLDSAYVSDIPNLVDKLHVSLDGIMKPVTSGFGFVDLIIPGLHKANGISRLLKRWKVSPQECVGIGDSGNDAEMLKLVKYSFAMGNAAESIRDVSRYSSDDNNHQGALNVIQAVLDHHSPFDA